MVTPTTHFSSVLRPVDVCSGSPALAGGDYSTRPDSFRARATGKQTPGAQLRATGIANSFL
jgi:hypothetical protein